PNIPSTPEYKNNKPSSTYNITNSQNISLAGTPIPCTYGTVKTYPALLTQPYYKYINNIQYMYSLMTFGHGKFNINKVYIGKSDVSTLENGDLEYKIITKENYKNEKDIISFVGDKNYHQEVYTSTEVSNLEIKGGVSIVNERYRVQDNKIYFYRNDDGTWPSLIFNKRDIIKLIQGSNGNGNQNNTGGYYIQEADNSYHTLSFDSIQPEKYRDIYSTKSTEFTQASTITTADTPFGTTEVSLRASIYSYKTFKYDFRKSQVLELTINGIKTYKTCIGTSYYEDDSKSVTTLEFEKFSGTPTSIRATDIDGSFEYQNSYGFYQTNPVDTKCKHIELDIVFRNGLYTSDDYGNLSNRRVNFTIIVKDVTGNEISRDYYVEDKTVTAVRKTIIVSVSGSGLIPGTYSIRIIRKTQELEDSKIQDKLVLERIKTPILLEKDNNWDDMSLMWVKIKATNAVSGSAQFQINANITRTDVGNTIKDVITDLYTNKIYGAGLNINTLVINDTPEEFNGSFETKIPVLDAIKSVGEAGRYVVTPKNGSVIVRKDEAKSIPSALFNETNIIPNSLEVTYQFGLMDDDEDSIEVTYRDRYTFKEKSIRYPKAGVNPSKKVLFGIIDEEVAKRQVQYLYKSLNKRILYKFDTGIQGVIPEYLDKVLIASESIDSGYPAIVQYVKDKEVTFLDTPKLTQISFIDKLFNTHGPYDITEWNDNTASIPNLPSFVENNTRCHLYNLITQMNEASITKISPKSQTEVTIEAIIYDDSVYDYELE
ncbi:MAG: hypothetical protein JJV90_01440, partial [Spiroplasma sp.]|nr:hypothetical protein [Mycoplasmatales bacterium]